MNTFTSLRKTTGLFCIFSMLLAACIPQTRVLPPSQSSQFQISPRISIGNMAARTNFELKEAPQPTDRRASSRSTPPTKAVFWSAIGLTILGGISTIALGATALHTGNQIDRGFTGEFTKAEFDKLEQRGKQLNTATIATASITAIAASIALIVYGVDYSRCGPLAPKRRRCEAAQPKPQVE